MPIERIRASDMKQMREKLDDVETLNKRLASVSRRAIDELKSKLWIGSGRRCQCCGVHFAERHHADCVLNNTIEILEDGL